MTFWQVLLLILIAIIAYFVLKLSLAILIVVIIVIVFVYIFSSITNWSRGFESYDQVGITNIVPESDFENSIFDNSQGQIVEPKSPNLNKISEYCFHKRFQETGDYDLSQQLCQVP